MKPQPLNKAPVLFNPENHTYTLLNGRGLSGITPLIHAVTGLGKYPTSSPYLTEVIIPRAAEHGSAVHRAIEWYDMTGAFSIMFPKSSLFANLSGDAFWDVSEELKGYVELKKGYVSIANEYLVSDNKNYATCIDNVWADETTGEIILADTKTVNLDYYPGGEEALKEYLSWQLSIEAEMFEFLNPAMKVSELLGNWLLHDRRKQWRIQRKSKDEVNAILATEHTEMPDGGFLYHVPTPMLAIKASEDNVLLVKRSVVDFIASITSRAKESARVLDEMKSELLKKMRKANVEKWDAGTFKATIVPDSAADKFDTERFKTEHPDLYKQYLITTKRKGGLQIRLKNE